MSTYAPPRPDVSSSVEAWTAWRRYLATVRNADAAAYAVVEASAWHRLQKELAAAGRPLGEEAPVRVLS